LRRGFSPLVVYVDDFLIIARSQRECEVALDLLIKTLRSLGFSIAWDKVVDPTQRITFLGLQIDSSLCTLSLDCCKHTRLISLLEDHLRRKRLTRKQIQRLAGKLSWAAAVVPWGRLYTRSLFDRLSSMKSNRHKCPVTAIQRDLHWWLLFLKDNSQSRILWDARDVITLATDSSSAAGGAFCGKDWLYTSWEADFPALQHAHINVKELAIVVASIYHWAPFFKNCRVQVFTDNTAALGILNKRTSPSPEAADILRWLSLLAMKQNFTVMASHVPGAQNDIPDAISRLHSPGQLSRLGVLFRSRSLPPYYLPRHMSHRSLSFLLQALDH
jgi:hypothetical protein